MPPDTADPVTILALVLFVLFGVYWWYRWQWRAAWFDRVWVEVAREREVGRGEPDAEEGNRTDEGTDAEGVRSGGSRDDGDESSR